MRFFGFLFQNMCIPVGIKKSCYIFCHLFYNRTFTAQGFNRPPLFHRFNLLKLFSKKKKRAQGEFSDQIAAVFCTGAHGRCSPLQAALQKALDCTCQPLCSPLSSVSLTGLTPDTPQDLYYCGKNNCKNKIMQI